MKKDNKLVKKSSFFVIFCNDVLFQLNFEEDLRINKMYSAEGECVDLIPDMYPTGGVESWLLKVNHIKDISIN